MEPTTFSALRLAIPPRRPVRVTVCRPAGVGGTVDSLELEGLSQLAGVPGIYLEDSAERVRMPAVRELYVWEAECRGGETGVSTTDDDGLSRPQTSSGGSTWT